MNRPLVLAIDPGCTQSAVVAYRADGQIRDSYLLPNMDVLARVREHAADDGDDYCGVLAIEMVACYGMAVGAEVFETCVWIGRFVEAWGRTWTEVYRKDVKLHLCNSMKANDSNIRQRLIDIYGGQEKAIGKKKTPGPLYGIKGDIWSALAVAVTYTDMREKFAQRLNGPAVAGVGR